MKHLLIITIAFISFEFSALAENVPSKIKDVTIYLKGARVERTASANLKPGENEIIFEDLSNEIDANSIEVNGQGNATILSVNYRINYLKQQQQTVKVRKLKVSLDSARLKALFLTNEIAVLEQENQLLQANYKLGVNDKTDYIEDVDEWAERYRKRVLEIRNSITKINIQSAEMVTLLGQLQSQLDQESANSKMPSGEIVVKVSSTNYGGADFKFAYYVQNAGWTPMYSLRATNTTQPVKLDYDAMVTQRTGEIWQDIKMILSTGNPTLGGNKPDLNPWYLNIQEYVYSRHFGKYKRGEGEAPMSAMAMGDKVSLEKDEMKNAGDNTTVTQNQLNVTFDINLKYSLAPDGTPQQVRIQQNTLPAIFEYAAVPKLDKDAFLLAKVTGWEEDNILPGEANLYFEGSYIGKSFIDPASTNDTLNLSFGRDKKINIERKQLKELSKKSFLGSKTTKTYVYEISIKNTKNVPITITLEDQLPVTQNKDIEVESKEISKADYEQSTGKLQWKLNLQPLENKKLKLEYNVKYPKNKVISGL